MMIKFTLIDSLIFSIIQVNNRKYNALQIQFRILVAELADRSVMNTSCSFLTNLCVNDFRNIDEFKLNISHISYISVDYNYN